MSFQFDGKLSGHCFSGGILKVNYLNLLKSAHKRRFVGYTLHILWCLGLLGIM